MNRRTILKSLVAAPAAVSLPAQTPAQEPAHTVEDLSRVELSVPDTSAEPVTHFFSKDQFAALTHLCETLEPSAPQTPGAREARAAEFLDFLLDKSSATRQTLYRSGLDRLNSDSSHRYNLGFAALDPAQTNAVLEPLRRPWTYEDSSDPFENFLRTAKSDILQATRNSYEFISAVSKHSRNASGVGEFWYPLY
jgi:hypothetical protein